MKGHVKADYKLKKKNMKKNSFLSVAAWMLCTLISLCGCMEMDSEPAEAQYLVMDKNVEYTPTVVDALCSSIANVNIESSMITFGDESKEPLRFKPTCYLNVNLAKEHIELSSAEETNVTLLDEKILSDQNFSEGATRGKDIVKEFYFSDGQVATVSYGWRFEIEPFETGTLEAPHVEVSGVRYINHVVENAEAGTFKATPAFDATLVTKSVSNAETVSLTLRPWYTLGVAAEPEPEPEPEYTFEVVWGEWHNGDLDTDGDYGHYQPVEIYVNKYVNGELQRRDRSYVELHAASPANSVLQTMVGAEDAMLQQVETNVTPVDPFVRNEYFTFNVKDQRVEIQLEGITVDFTEYSSCTVTYTDGEFSKDISFEMAYEYAFSKVDRQAEALESDPAWSYFTYLNSEVCEITTTKVVNTDGVESKGDLEPIMRTVTVDKFK